MLLSICISLGRLANQRTVKCSQSIIDTRSDNPRKRQEIQIMTSVHYLRWDEEIADPKLNRSGNLEMFCALMRFYLCQDLFLGWS